MKGFIMTSFESHSFQRGPDVTTAQTYTTDEQVRFIDEKELAQLLSVSVSLVHKWRREGTGPKVYRLGGSRICRYRHADVIEWAKGDPK
jgi:predicted DNA-binding transcriptional regulator AlpA